MNLLSTIIDRLNQRIEVGNIFDQIYGLSELAADGNDKAWIHYIGNGQAIPVTNFDAKQGTLFWAKRGKISVNKIETFRLAGCKSMYETRYSLSANAVVRKSHLPCDSADAQDWIASRVLKLISGTDPQFKTAIGVVSYEVVPSGYTNEIKSLPANYEWASVTIDVDINVVSGSEDGCYDTCAKGDIPLPDFEPCTPCLTEVAVDGVTITGNGTPANPLVAIGGGGGTPLITQDEGVNVSTNTTTLNFTGAGVTASLTSPGVVEVNVPGGGGGGEDLQQTTDIGNSTTNDIDFIGNAGLAFDNGARFRKGTTDAGNGGAKGTAQICSINYELKWEAGRLYYMEQDGFTIRDVTHNFTFVPQPTDDQTKGFVVGTRWSLDDGTVYVCTDDTVGTAVWVLQSVGGVTAVTATAPIASSGGATPDISITQADATTDGYLSSADWNTFDGKQDQLTAGTGISITGVTIDNTAPDQIVNLTSGTDINVSGTYPNFTIDNTAPDQVVGLTAGTGIAVSGSYPNFTIDNTATFTSPLISKGDIYVHDSSSDTRLPVGLDTQVLIADSSQATGLRWGSNTAATPTGYYGQWQDQQTQTAAASNVGYPMIFNVTDLSNGVTMVTDGTNLTRITFANTGIYNLQFSVQIQNIDNAEHDVTIWLRKLSIDVPGSAGFVQVPKRRAAGAGNEGHIITSWNYLLDVIGGEYYQLIWSTTNHTKVTLQYYAAGNPPPSTASTLVTVTQQSGIMAGTGLTAINSLSTAVQTLATGTSGTDFAINSAGSTHSFNLPVASATNTGKLSSTDWSTFNSKEPAIASGTTSQYWRGDKSWQTLDKSAVGLGNVDNTSDLNKPISNATQTALNGKFNNPTGTTSQYIRGDGSLQTFPTLTNGTVTSVSASVPAPASPALSVAVTNATTTPAIAITANGSTSQYVRGDGSLATFPTIPSGTVTSVGLTMPAAFSVANSPVTSSGTLAVTGAGTTAQYIRGDGSLATFPTSIPVIYKSALDGTSITGVATEQISASQLIPANTFAVGDIIRISWRTRKTGTITGSTFKLYINTSASLAGAIQLGILSIAGSTNLTNQMQRSLAIKSATNTEAFANVNVSDDFTFTSPAVISSNIDWTVNQHIIFMCQLQTATADTVRTSFYLIEKL